MTDESALRSLDHLVIAVHDLDRSIADYRSMGFTVNPGGRHPGRSSHNALIVFADGAYIELIGLKKALDLNKPFEVTLQFGSSAEQTVQGDVRELSLGSS